MKKLMVISVMCAMLIAMVAVSGCITGDDDSNDMALVKNGKLVVGMEAQFPPFEIILADGSFYGFDIALAEEIGKELGLEIEFVDTDFASIIAALNADKFDVVISGMTITAERAESVFFSDAYFDAGLTMAVPVGSSIASVEDLTGMRVGVQLGSTGDLYASELDNIAEIKRYAHAPDAFMDMKNGNIDVVINDGVVSAPIVSAYPDDFVMLADLLTVEEYGIAISKDNPLLLEAINNALAAIKADGRYDQIYEEFINNWSE
jgi:polar amino acid transport system substrate-binding protein